MVVLHRCQADESGCQTENVEGSVRMPGAIFMGRWIRFGGHYPVFRHGFLDGYEGLIFHFLHACWYRFYADTTIVEILREER